MPSSRVSPALFREPLGGVKGTRPKPATEDGAPEGVAEEELEEPEPAIDKDAAQLARELGIRRNQLYKWKAEVDSHGEKAFPGKGGRPKKVSSGDAAALQAENKRLREENEILKKAAIFFARESD